jgi:hypothetical protein
LHLFLNSLVNLTGFLATSLKLLYTRAVFIQAFVKRSG